MIRFFVPKINNEVVKVARQLARKQKMDVIIESHDEYMEIFCERKYSKINEIFELHESTNNVEEE